LLERTRRGKPQRDQRAIAKEGLDCDLQLTGELSVAKAPWQGRGQEHVATDREIGYAADLLDAGRAFRAELDCRPRGRASGTPTGTARRSRTARLGPAASLLARACGMYENSRGRFSIRKPDLAFMLHAGYGAVWAARVALGTGALMTALLRRARNVGRDGWDYVLMTER